MDMKSLSKLNLKDLVQLKQQESNPANLEIIEKRMETIRERYKKKNMAKKKESSDGSSSPKSDNSNSKIWTSPDPECCRQTTLAHSASLLKNYVKEQKKSTKKRDDPKETAINQMIMNHLNEPAPFPFKFLENYDITSITFNVIAK
jgi:hypothetical protein